MNHQIFEEESAAPSGGAPSGGMTDAKAKIEKQARQLAYDTRYDVKKELGDKKVDPQRLKGEFIKRLQRSSSSSAVKLRAKQMLLGEDYISETRNLASKSVAMAMFKVFVEGNDPEPSAIELNYLKELAENPDKKYKVRVKDKKSGNSYVRYATREKINQLRSNPNISSVEMTEYGEPREGEKNRGEETAAAKSGKDYDGDGKVESGAKEYRGAVHNAIQRKKGLPGDGKDTSSVKESKNLPGNQEKIDANKNGKVDANDFTLLRARKSKKSVKEEFIGEVKGEGKEEKKDNKKITGENVDNSKLVKVFPEIEVQEKFSSYQIFRSMVQEKMDLAKSEMGDVVKDFYKSDAPQFKGKSKKKRQEMAIAAKLEAERKSGVKEETECETDKKEKDPRSLKTDINLIKNKFRSMGLKMSYEPEGKMVDEAKAIENIDELNRYEKETGKDSRTGKPTSSGGKYGGNDAKSKAIRSVMKSMGSGRMGVQPRGQKKEPGKKPPKAGEYGGPVSPAQKVAKRRANVQRSKDMMSSRFD